ncbi:hypothetical protein D3C78_1727450 [compost metagenome]
MGLALNRRMGGARAPGGKNTCIERAQPIKQRLFLGNSSHNATGGKNPVVERAQPIKQRLFLGNSSHNATAA